MCVLQAVQAGELSQRQLALATDMGDPLLAAKCRIFAAYSLLQRGRLKAASRIIRLDTHTHTSDHLSMLLYL